LTEILFALGAGDRVIGVTRFCKFPPEAQAREPLGDLFQPNLEAMVAARADLIVLVPGNRKVHEFFSTRTGSRLLETNACETIDDIKTTIRWLGTAVGASEKSEMLVRGIEAGLDSVRQQFETAPRVRYLMILGHDQGALEQIYVTGHDNYLTELAELAHGENAVGSELGRYPILSREAIVSLDPEVIIERHLGGRATEADRASLLALWSRMPVLRAVKRNRVVVLDDDHVTIPGPDLVRSARVLAALLHGPESR
jgi:iron complex transport system substrate-binding protein